MMGSGKTTSATEGASSDTSAVWSTTASGWLTRPKVMACACTSTGTSTKANGSKIYAGAGESKFSPMGIYTKVNGRTMPWMAVVDTRMRITATSRESFRKVCKCPANTHLQTDL